MAAECSKQIKRNLLRMVSLYDVLTRGMQEYSVPPPAWSHLCVAMEVLNNTLKHLLDIEAHESWSMSPPPQIWSRLREITAEVRTAMEIAHADLQRMRGETARNGSRRRRNSIGMHFAEATLGAGVVTAGAAIEYDAQACRANGAANAEIGHIYSRSAENELLVPPTDANEILHKAVEIEHIAYGMLQTALQEYNAAATDIEDAEAVTNTQKKTMMSIRTEISDFVKAHGHCVSNQLVRLFIDATATAVVHGISDGRQEEVDPIMRSVRRHAAHHGSPGSDKTG